MNKAILKIKDNEYSITLNDSQAAQDFYDLLPLDVALTNFSTTEKVADLPKKLTTKDSPSGVEAAKGDICYYAPWGNLAIFYRDFRYSEGLVNLGKIDAGSEMLENLPEPFNVQFYK